MGLSAVDYGAQLAALLPRGRAWPSDPDSHLARLLGAWADEFGRVDGRAWALLGEADPRGALALLIDWERAYGLPDQCTRSEQTTGARRAALLARIQDSGGQRPADYLALAAALGIAAELIEYRPHTVDDTVDAPLCGADWAYAWRMHIAEPAAISHWSVDGRCTEPLASWTGAEDLRCLLRRRKPAHSTLLITYNEDPI